MKYHTIKLDKEYTVRDVPYLPNTKKYRIGTMDLKHRILEMLSAGEQVAHLRYINNRIHFFIEEQFIHEPDEVLTLLIEKNFSQYKNNIEIN